MKTHHKKSKRQKLSLKYNIQKRVREHKRRVRKEAKKLGVAGRKRKDPGIPNSWPFKAEMLEEIEREKEKREKEIDQKRAQAKARAKAEAQQAEKQRQAMFQQKDAERKQKREQQVQKSQRDALRRMLLSADVLIQVLDARDPMGCRCFSLEAWAQQHGKKLVYVLAKADLVPPSTVAQWLQFLAHAGPAVAVQAEAGREGVKELLQMLGRSAGVPGCTGVTAAERVGILGYACTGKTTLSRAIRREVQGTAKWLMDVTGKLTPASDATLDSPARLLHMMVRGICPKFAATGEAQNDTRPMAMVKLFVERAPAAAVMRRFRLPAFEGCEGLLKEWGTAHNLKNKKGKLLVAETLARRFVAELNARPGCYSEPSQAATDLPSLWAAHGTLRQTLEDVMRTQVGILVARDAGSVAGAIPLKSCDIGPAVDMDAALAEPKLDDDLDGVPEIDMDDEDGDGEEGEEEFYEEGEEEEDDDMDDEEEE